MEQNELLPQNKEAEQATLGAILESQESYDQIKGFLKPDSFFWPAHRVLYAELLALEEDQIEWRLGDRAEQPILLIQHLRIRGDRMSALEAAGGAGYLVELLEMAPYGNNVMAFAEVVRDLAAVRTVIQAGLRIAERGRKNQHAGVQMLLSQARDFFREIEFRQKLLAPVSAEIVLAKTHAQFERFKQNPERVMAHMDVDQFVRGFEAGYIHIIGARTSQGKSTALSQIALFNALRKVPSLTFTLEMMEWEYFTRQVCQYQGLSGWKWLKGAFKEITPGEWRAFDEGAEDLRQLPLYYQGDGRRMTIEEIGYQGRAHIREFGVKAIFLDHLKMVKTPTTKKEFYDQQTWRIEELSDLAKDWDVPVFVGAQINRQGDDVPSLKDLEGSGAIEQYAGVVMLLHCPDLKLRQTIDINVAKGRNNRTGTLSFPWKPGHFLIGPGRIPTTGEAPWDQPEPESTPLMRPHYQQTGFIEDPDAQAE